MSKNIVSVYDTITKRYVEIEVSEKIRTYYNRTQWNIDDNNKSFYKHEIQFSALKGNINGEFENFQEFRTENDDVERRVIQNIKCEKLYSCLNELTEDERRLIFAIYFENKTENEVAYFLHTTQQNINKKKRRILCKLNKLLKSQ
jgi:RNA polymerase sigma factor (sigma-70 family)